MVKTKEKLTAKNFYSYPRTIEETARYFGFSERYIREEVYRGLLRGRKFSARMVRFLPEDIRAWERLKATTEEVSVLVIS